MEEDEEKGQVQKNNKKSLTYDQFIVRTIRKTWNQYIKGYDLKE